MSSQELFYPLAQNLADDFTVHLASELLHHQAHNRAEALLAAISDEFLLLPDQPVADRSDRVQVYLLDPERLSRPLHTVPVLKHRCQYVGDRLLREGPRLPLREDVLYPNKAHRTTG